MRPNLCNRSAYFVDGYNTQELFREDKKFHYFNTREVATNITQNIKADLYGAIIQSYKALFYLRGYSRILNAKGMFFPVVVYNGPGKIFDQNGNEHKNLLYFRTYEWKEPHTQEKVVSRNIYVDVIHESNLENYLGGVFKKEMDFLMANVIFDRGIAENKRRSNLGL